MGYLVLVRHGESEWNAKGLWTGWTDIGLSNKGREEARLAGEKIKDIPFNLAFVSKLIRSKQTLDEIEKVLGTALPREESQSLNERNYGIFTGKNKFEIEKELGEEEFKKLRRGWDVPVENGESLKQVYERVLPYYKEKIEPKLTEGKNVIISAHGNSLRALVKYLDNVADEQIPNLEIATGQVYVYNIDSNGKTVSKEVR